MPARLLPASAATSACSLAAAGVVAASLAELPALRDQPGGPNAPPVPPRFLRHSDEQTVVGLAAVLQAMDSSALRDACYGDWGVVAAPVFPGRMGGAGTFTKFREGGCAAISPHIIPQNSLHSVAGAISICLGMHGPNFGIGGGPDALAEGLTVALSLVDQSSLPGLWLVLTQWSPEPVPDGRGSTQTETTCHGIALALLPGAGQGLTLRMTLPESQPSLGKAIPRLVLSGKESDPLAAAVGREGLAELAGWLWSFGLPWGGRVELVQEQYQQQTKAA
ncbi:MAG: hypothetical protein MUF25_18495 [Pirellulaceae bacterium]|nr:hypothetical protein [Pirellulaceae bacterium]